VPKLRLPRFVEWVPAIIAAVVLPIAVVLFFNPFSARTPAIVSPVATIEAFAPIKVDPFILETPSPYHVGQVVSMKNGVCNTSKETVVITFKLGVKEEADPLGARNVIVAPKEGSDPIMLPIAPGCLQNSDVLTGPLPPSVGPGKWRVYLIITALGSDSKRQMITMQSSVFEVIP
jgi:hypothetical protein